jgi:hypothetical protein
MDLYKQTTSVISTGQGTSTAAPAPIVDPSLSRLAYKGVRVKAAKANTSPIYLGASGVSIETGYELDAGESVELWIEDPAKVFAVSSNNQAFSWVSL